MMPVRLPGSHPAPPRRRPQGHCEIPIIIRGAEQRRSPRGGRTLAPFRSPRPYAKQSRSWVTAEKVRPVANRCRISRATQNTSARSASTISAGLTTQERCGFISVAKPAGLSPLETARLGSRLARARAAAASVVRLASWHRILTGFAGRNQLAGSRPSALPGCKTNTQSAPAAESPSAPTNTTKARAITTASQILKTDVTIFIAAQLRSVCGTVIPKY